MTWQTTLRRNVRAEMTRVGCTQADVGQQLGITGESIRRRLHGDVEFRIGELLYIAHVLGITLEDLLGKTEDDFREQFQTGER